jgi:uncharacterized sulfatase
MNIRKSSLILSVVLASVVAGQSTAAPHASNVRKPNILLIIVDDLRDHLGCYGKSVVKSPHIDRLAARGVRFDRAYVQYPVCNPSRSSFLTGLRPDQTGVLDNRTFLREKRPAVVTLPQLLRQNGWHTASYGKVFHVGEAAGEVRDAWMDAAKSWDEAKMFLPTEAGRKGDVRNLTGGKLDWCDAGPMEGGDDDQPDGQNAAHAIRAIEQQTAAGKPWLIGLGFHKPHNPFFAPKKYFDLYPPQSLTLYRDPPHTTPLYPLSIAGGSNTPAFDAFSDRDRLDFLRAYYACTSFMDAQVGRVLDALDRLKLWERTMVIFVGDNGYHLGERGWWNKNTLFERSCRVPFIVAAPGTKPSVARGLVELVDIFPTVAVFCGVKPPPVLVGQDLRPLLDDPARPGKPAAFTMVTRGLKHRGDSIRTERWRYTEWSDGTKELYDHDNDPEETENVADAQPDLVVRLHEHIAAKRPAK